ncbi:unnamed protein product [Adineta steineri]|uniref:SprT-like domain-containing protein n=1 Tax=Adineta steineri TaxID=433720 RepID=A0A813VGU9_9BILA|nr:unnamed protein product [Adineta steineri]CAF0859566.1 unnamed protein product [Adineta steineri]CAF0920089.1 unnamed protein product [Adineta steineri]
MTEHNRDLSFTTLSSIDSIDIPLKTTDFDLSLESYRNLFNKDKHNFTASSEISFENHHNENPLLDNHNRTFTKEISKTLVNAFTGKPISPNPWRKLCTKNIQQHIETDIPIPIEIFSPNPRLNKEKIIPQDQSNNGIKTRQRRRDTINNQSFTDSSNDDEQSFEQVVQEHETSIIVKHQVNTPVQRRRKKRNSLKNVIDKSSSSSPNENIKIDILPKTNQLIPNDPLWQRLADVYTSESSDENNHLLLSNMNYTARLKSEIYTSDQSSSSSRSSTKTDARSSIINDDRTTSYNFLESLAERIPFADKHLDAQSYFIQSGFKLKEKRQELANKLLFLFNQDVFSSKLTDKVSVIWSSRLTATAGHCTTRKSTYTAVITLSHKVCDSPERCRDTLLHEMCHSAVTLIDGVMEHGHGPRWRQWTHIAQQSYPYLPPISIRHTYDVNYKYIYRCIQCQHEVSRHSKSLNLEVDFCGKCMGKFDLILNSNFEDKQTPRKTINKYNLYVKENFQIIKQANPHLSTPQLMKQLSQEYKKQKQQQIATDLPDLNQLKI